jgi:hypothetical protein
VISIGRPSATMRSVVAVGARMAQEGERPQLAPMRLFHFSNSPRPSAPALSADHAASCLAHTSLPQASQPSRRTRANSSILDSSGYICSINS